MSAACCRYGTPWRCLSDNGLCFSGKIRGFEVYFEEQLRAAGIQPVTARPFHPQTCGKVERFQQTLKKWLRAHGPFETIADLQGALDRFRDHYNHQRPHRAIGRVTPFERWSATPRVANPGVALPAPARRSRGVVDVHGCVLARPYQFGVGTEHAGRTAEVLLQDGYANVFIDGLLVRHVEIDPTRRYQPSGRGRGRPGQPRPHRQRSNP